MTPPRLGRLLVALALAACVAVLGSASGASSVPRTGIVCTTSATNTFDLVATDGTIQLPDGNAVYMWSYANGAAPANGAFQYPGPVLCVDEGATVTVRLRNGLAQPTSVVFPGQDGQVTATGGANGLLTREAAPGQTVTYSFVAGAPGTYLYESGTDIAKQIEMGLYGALVVRPSLGGAYAYDDAATKFDPSREYMLLLGEIDPDLHHAVETGGTYDFSTLHNHYFTINGRSFPDTLQDNGSSLLPAQPYGALIRTQPGATPALIRMLNAGADNHPFHPHGNHTLQIAQDGRMLQSPAGAHAFTEHFGETIAAGQTEDFLLPWVDADQWNPTSNQFPIAAPSYVNVTFKDSATWYSGSPYLGYKGTLPTGTTTQNLCGEWYFPMHSHALNEFANYDAGFGGMGTLLRVDPPGGCFAAASSTALPGAVLKAGSVAALATDDTATYQLNPKTTNRGTGTMSTSSTSLTVTSAAGFPTTGAYYVQVDSGANVEVMRVTAGQGTTTWTVQRGQLGSSARSHAAGVVVTALATDWYAGLSGVPLGSQNLKVTYTGANCASTTATTCTSLTTALPQQTTKVCDWTIAGATGCSTQTSAGWVALPAPQAVQVGSTQVTTTWALPAATMARYIGTGTNKGQVRLLVHTERYTTLASTGPTPFSTWGNSIKLVYDAP